MFLLVVLRRAICHENKTGNLNMELLIILEGEGEDREGGMEGGEEGEGGRGGVLWWWNHTHELPTKREGLLAIWRTNYYNYPWGLCRTPHGMRQGEGLGNSSSPKPRYAHACARAGGIYESRDRMAPNQRPPRQQRTARNGTRRACARYRIAADHVSIPCRTHLACTQTGILPR